MKSRTMLVILVLVLSFAGSSAAQLSLGWRDADVGNASLPGSALYDAGTDTCTVTGDGLYIWGNSDDFHYTCKRLRGDGQIGTRVVSLTGARPTRVGQARCNDARRPYW